VNSYFSTHPPTPERVSKTRAGAANYPLPQPINGRDTYLRQIDGMVYGDSAKQGFEKGGVFYHPDIGFSFKLPQGYRLINQPQQIALKSKTSDAVALFDFAKVPAPDLASDPLAYLRDGWMKGEPLQHLEAIKINGLKAATALFSGKVNGTPSAIRLVAVLWQDGQYARFQVALPEGLGDDELTALKKFTYSLRRMGDQERSTIKPPHIDVVSAKAGDRLSSFIQRLAFSDDAEAKFRTLNAMDAQERLVAGRSYKLVVND
jgi:predicted Zn-dependent protease